MVIGQYMVIGLVKTIPQLSCSSPEITKGIDYIPAVTNYAEKLC